ncbi:hypothetical protein OXPF_35570 [Oxobacter pfennigii]|uniref:ABC-2 family transporter protein n=1 Tax=Oxobacter pfennigii TaxID=36849 RepID=A0A0P9ACH1_9CLOT|nr:ABC-2 transporter permease [Oxobacter pfennigii]KPU42794.1 hypothetical protein OXPF_35570 [Oxobacter pfennigii]
MLNLIFKDILIQKKTFLYSVLYALFAVVGITNSFTSRGAYIFGSIGIAYLFVMYSNTYDDKNGCEITLNSLPVSRKDIVLAKYMSVLVFIFIGIIMTVFAGMLVKMLLPQIPLQNMVINDIFMIFACIILMYSIYYPMYFKFGAIKVRMLNMVLYLIFLFGPINLIALADKNTGNSMLNKLLLIITNNPDFYFYAFAAALLLGLMLISLNISIYVYSRKDL